MASSLAAPAAWGATTGSNGSHDPSRLLQSEGKLYIYSTGGGAKSSTDGLSWKQEASPPWNRSLSDNQGLWAPDGIKLNGKYLLFGSMWNDAKSSRIVLLTTPSLDPAKADWKEVGTVVDGPSGVSHSVIDPAPVLDAAGNLYVVWGGGYPFPNEADSIFLTRLDSDTGLPLVTDPGYKPPASPGYALEQGHKEGPYIHLRDGSYFLFYQTGGCCSGASSTYTIHVARAQDIKGPYTGDRTFYSSKGSIHGPGHMGVYDACGFERFTYHYYPDSGGSVIGENELEWEADGWPRVGPESTTPIVPCPAGEAGSSAGTGGTAGAGGAAPIGGASAAGTSATGSAGTPAGAGSSQSGGAGLGQAGFAASAGGTPGVSGAAALASPAGSSPSGPDAGSEAGCACTIPSDSVTSRGWLGFGLGGALLLLRLRRRA